MNKDLTVGSPAKVLWTFCLPLFGSIIFQQLYNLADSFVAGKFIGEDALAAVGNGYEITLIFIAFAFGCNIGCSVIVSRFFGAHKLADLKTAVSTTFISVGVLCAVLCQLAELLPQRRQKCTAQTVVPWLLLFGIFGVRMFMRSQTDIEAIVDYGTTYLTIICLVSFGLFFQMTMERILYKNHF